MGTTKLHKLCYQPGVVMYVDDDNICRDMEVSPEVSVLHIGEQKKPSKTNPPLLFSLDKRKNYVFSGIKELVIEEGTCGVFVANTMFPNVKRVTSHNRQYLSSDRMLITIRDDTKRMLLHVFDLESTAQIDLRWISQIGTKAFTGCKSVRLVNCDCVECCHDDAFADSAFAEAAYDHGLKIAGGIVFDVDETAEEIVFPDDKKIFAIQEGLKFYKAKRVVLKDVGLIPMLSHHHLPETLVIDDPNFRNLDKLSPIELNVSIKRIETTDRVKYFSSYDGILYNKTQIELLLCPKGRNGETVIPEGVRTIRQQAFRRSHIVSVKMPDSLRTIEDQAFEYCKQLKHVDFGHGLKRMRQSPNMIGPLPGCALFKSKAEPESPSLLIQVRCSVLNTFFVSHPSSAMSAITATFLKYKASSLDLQNAFSKIPFSLFNLLVLISIVSFVSKSGDSDITFRMFGNVRFDIRIAVTPFLIFKVVIFGNSFFIPLKS